jgi:hypothetical protein
MQQTFRRVRFCDAAPPEPPPPRPLGDRAALGPRPRSAEPARPKPPRRRPLKDLVSACLTRVGVLWEQLGMWREDGLDAVWRPKYLILPTVDDLGRFVEALWGAVGGPALDLAAVARMHVGFLRDAVRHEQLDRAVRELDRLESAIKQLARLERQSRR